MTGHPTSATIITALKEMFSEHGTPEKLISDNGPQFSSAVFEAFSKEWNFKHVTSSPRYPQSNGFIERQVKTVKAAMEKAKDADADPSKALQYLRATPIDAHLPSPSELLLGRKIRTNLPSKITNQLPEKDAIYQRLQTRQDEQKKYLTNCIPTTSLLCKKGSKSESRTKRPASGCEEESPTGDLNQGHTNWKQNRVKSCVEIGDTSEGLRRKRSDLRNMVTHTMTNTIITLPQLTQKSKHLTSQTHKRTDSHTPANTKRLKNVF